jgi:hypothetical protein
VGARKRLGLFCAGVALGVSLFLIGGVGVVPAHTTLEPTATLEPWLLRTMCDYPAVDCTSRGPVVTSPAAIRFPRPRSG